MTEPYAFLIGSAIFGFFLAQSRDTGVIVMGLILLFGAGHLLTFP